MNRDFEILTIGETRVLFVMAGEAEFGECLQQLFRPLFTGVGPVEAAVVVTRTLTTLEEGRELPDIVVSLGSAGSARLSMTKVYQVSAVSYRDMDASPLGYPKGETPYLGQPAEIPLSFQIPDVPLATLSTGANVINQAAYADIKEDMVDMETFAVLRACQGFDVSLVALRGISDGEKELEGVDDWAANLCVVDRNLAHACELFRSALTDPFANCIRPASQ